MHVHNGFCLLYKGPNQTIEEMEKEIPFHLNGCRNIIENCIANGIVTKSDFFCTRFINALLFLRVKCSRPIMFQFILIVTTFWNAKLNKDSSIRQFTMSTKYLFDTLIFTNDVMIIIDLYLENIRPRLNPTCEYLLLSSNGTQFNLWKMPWQCLFTKRSKNILTRHDTGKL